MFLLLFYHYKLQYPVLIASPPSFGQTISPLKSEIRNHKLGMNNLCGQLKISEISVICLPPRLPLRGVGVVNVTILP
jgi:hypothetical protein